MSIGKERRRKIMLKLIYRLKDNVEKSKYYYYA